MPDTMTALWSTEEEVKSFGIEVPKWIDSDIGASQVAAILQGGCDSGAYMPAVTCHQAREMMNEYGDDVLDYLQGIYGKLPKIPDDESWSGIAVLYLSMAVECWAISVEEELASAIEEAEAA